MKAKGLKHQRETIITFNEEQVTNEKMQMELWAQDREPLTDL